MPSESGTKSFNAYFFVDKLTSGCVSHPGKDIEIHVIHFYGRITFINLKKNCTILIVGVNSYCRRMSSTKDLGLKSHPKDYQQKLTY